MFVPQLQSWVAREGVGNETLRLKPGLLTTSVTDRPSSNVALRKFYL